MKALMIAGLALVVCLGVVSILTNVVGLTGLPLALAGGVLVMFAISVVGAAITSLAPPEEVDTFKPEPTESGVVTVEEDD